MTDLIKKLEALEAPCRECDGLIAAAFGLKHGPDSGWCNNENGDHWVVDECAARYTTSIDATMTLVPEGDYDQDWVRTTRAASEGFKLWQVRIALETTQQDPDETSPVALGEHDNPAIALCIAALRAQEASNAGR